MEAKSYEKMVQYAAEVYAAYMDEGDEEHGLVYRVIRDTVAYTFGVDRMDVQRAVWAACATESGVE